MNQQLIDVMRADIALFAEKLRAFEAGEVDKKAYKGFSGGFGSYAQRNGGNMLRLRMSGGRLTKEKLAARSERTMWRYRELLPIEETTEPTPLRVGWSPLYEEPRLAEELGLKRLWVKDDGLNPTASLKDRASAMAVAKAKEAGAKVIVAK